MLKTVSTAPSSFKGDVRRPQLTMTLAFVNNTGRTITVLWRNGTTATVSPTIENNAKGSFSVIVTFSLSTSVHINAHTNTYSEGSVERRLFEEALAYGIRGNNTVKMCYTFQYEELDGCRGVYHDILDLVITACRGDDVPQHPRSEHHGCTSMQRDDEQGMLTYRLLVIDKQGLFGRRYVNLGGEVFEVPVAKYTVLPDGVYISYSAGKRSAAKFYPLADEAGGVRFWFSHAEAKAHGDELEVIKREYDKRKQELKNQELVLSAERAKIEAEHKLHIQQLEAENKRFESRLSEQEKELEHLRKVKETQIKMQENEQKHQYEEQAIVRKNTSEWLKVVPSVIGFLGLAFGLYRSSV